MGNNISTSILTTLSYADIFDFPLTKEELYKRLVISKSISYNSFEKALARLSDSISYKDGYYFLKGRRKIVKRRQMRSLYSKKKLKKAVRIAHLLSFIPGILLIGLSGSLAVDNCLRSDDIDFFFITEKNMLWIARFFVAMMLFIMGEKRKRNQKVAKDKICANMFVSCDALTIKRHDRSLYMAYEIGQMKVLVQKGNTYEEFIKKNTWVRSFLSHMLPTTRKIKAKKHSSFILVTKYIDRLFFFAQYQYMKKKITHEKINTQFAYFHPINREIIIQKELEKRLHVYENFQPQKGNFVKTKKINKAIQLQVSAI